MLDARHTLVEIDRALARWLDTNVPLGLLDGACGAALFYAYYAQLGERDEHVERVHRIVGDAVDALASHSLGPGHCTGVAGIAWCLQHLTSQGFIDASDEVFDPLDEVTAHAMVQGVRAGARDVLHDGLGAVLYLVERSARPHVRASLELVVAELERTATRDARGARWTDDRARYSLGLAHGNPGILAMLAQLVRAGIAPGRSAALLADGVRWLRSTRFPDPGTGSWYPTAVDGDGVPTRQVSSRLGWCYGDLGIAISLFHAGATLGDASLVDEAAELLRHAARHREPAEGHVADAALCHGSMGIAQIYRRAALVTGDAAFAVMADRWIDHGLAQARWTDGAAGFKYALADGYVPSFSVLQGVAGIGLALIAALGGPSESAWDRSLFLS